MFFSAIDNHGFKNICVKKMLYEKLEIRNTIISIPNPDYGKKIDFE